jgi:catechol 2,3-dioxygenase-like lactoylglutathione lyase family enzyme
MPERLITHLRHVALGVPDYHREVEFYTTHWGLTPVVADDGIVFLAAEGSPEQYVMRLRRDEGKRVDLVAFGAASPADVDTLAQRLGSVGVRLVSEPGPLDTPGGGYAFRFFDNEGRTVEVSAGVAERPTRELEEKEDIPARLSHVVLNSADPTATVRFYEDHLGFKLSDTLTSPFTGDIMWFLRCNRRHHSIAIAAGPHAALHHASFEMRGIDEYMRGTGRLMRAGVTKVWGPGRHTAGDNTFSYFLDPLGNTVEYTTELEEVDEDTWEPHLYDFTKPELTDQWGTANPMSEQVAKESFNEPDTGLYVAPPV